MGGSVESKLTAQEKVVLALVCRGLTNDEIGRHCGVTESTAKAHVRALLRKLEAANRAELAAKAVTQGLVRFAPSGTRIKDE